MERAGTPSVSLTLVKEITLQLRPPRAVFLPWPLGHPFGKPGRAEQQRAALRAMLGLLETADAPGALIEPDVPW